MSELKLTITGMTCAHCVRAVTQALEGVPGVIKAEVSLQPGAAVIHGEADLQALITAVTKEGYHAEVQT
ncbi:MAG: CopZ family metallochaperone [Halothiobacillus sp.]